MSSLFVLTFLTALVLLCLCTPSVRRAILAGDDTLDAHEAGIALVASRNPFREKGPPACMAKLIMLRHKMQTSARKRRSPAAARQPRIFTHNQPARPRSSWVRFGRSFGGKQHH
ncbi:hypothetical protein J3A83DRAFT_2025779 [Scleroderma citrinum]